MMKEENGMKITKENTKITQKFLILKKKWIKLQQDITMN